MTKFEYSAGAFVYRVVDGKIIFLLLKKPNGEYDIPKGHIEKGETPEIAARREILEESGINAQFIPYFSVTTKYFFRRGKEGIAKRVKYFLCEVSSPKVKISNEHIGYEWLEHDEAVKRFKFKDLIRLIDSAFDYVTRYRKISEINAEYAKLAFRPGWRLSTNLVPGEGRLDTGLMIIGQAPGADEERLRRPFIGRSGRLLEGMLKSVKIERKNAYITSVVQFFPPKNRMPERDEVELCMPFLLRQMEIVRPKYVILLGNVSTYALVGITGAEINHGTVIEKDGRVYMVTLHPAAVLRFPPKGEMMLGDFRKFKKIIDKKGDAD